MKYNKFSITFSGKLKLTSTKACMNLLALSLAFLWVLIKVAFGITNQNGNKKVTYKIYDTMFFL